MASEDEFSDLTDIDVDDEDYGGQKSKSKGKGRAKGSGGEWRIQHALIPPRATSYTTQALYDQIHGNDIKLDPEYQRDVVWPDVKMIGLIDSIMRNFYIPPLIFAVIHNEDGTEKRICIDGKQRLSSIQRFMDGLIPHKDPVTSEKLWYVDHGSGRVRKRILPEKYRRVFATKQVVCVEYLDLSDRDEREIFQRVQLGMALTPAEKLQVISTPRATFIRSLLSHFSSSSGGPDPELPASSQGSLNEFDWERGRAADFRCFTQITSLLHSYHYSTTTPAKLPKGTHSIQSLEKFLSDSSRFEKAFLDRVKGSLLVLGAMAQDGSDALQEGSVKDVFKTPTKLAPVEFIMCGVLIGVHLYTVGFRPLSEQSNGKDDDGDSKREKRARKVLADSIRQLRTLVRQEHVDIRNNERVSKTMLDYIVNWSPDKSTSTTTTTKGKEKKEKRKRSNGDVEDGEVDGTPKAKVTKTIQTSAREHSILTPSQTQNPNSSASAAPPRKSLPTPIPLPIQPKAAKTDRMAMVRAAKKTLQAQSQHVPVTDGNISSSLNQDKHPNGTS